MKIDHQNSNSIQIFWVMVGSLSTFSLSIISAAILSRYFDKVEYGTYRQIIYVYNTLLIFFSAGLPKVFSYFLPKYTQAQGKDIASKLNKALFISGFIFSLSLFFCSDTIANVLKNPSLSIGLKYFSPIPLLMFPTLGIEGIFATYRNTIFIAIYNTFSKLCTLCFIVLPVIIFNGGYIHAIYGWITASLISLIIAIYLKNLPFKSIKRINSSLSYKSIFSYSIPLVTASIAGIAIKAADQFYVSRFFGPSVFAIFSNGFTELPFVAMITASTSTVLMPVFSKLYTDDSKKGEIIHLWKITLIKSSYIIYPLVIFFIFNAQKVIILLYSPSYIESVIFFRISLCLNFFNIIIFTPLILSMGYSKLYSQIHFYLAIIAWSVGYLIILAFNSAVSIAIFSVSLSIFKIMIFFYYTSKLLNISFAVLFPVRKIFCILIHSLCAIMATNLILYYITIANNTLATIIIEFFLFTIILISSAKFFNLDYLQVIIPLYKKLYLAKK